MHNYRRCLLVFILSSVCWVTACVHQPSSEAFSACVAGTQCTLKGKLNLQSGAPAWAALLEAGDSCAKLALPDDFYSDASKWNGKRVEVSGRAFRQPSTDTDDGFITWYTEKERKLAVGVCDGGMGIYVESIKSRSGQRWPVSVN